jgi:hypothetical protein
LFDIPRRNQRNFVFEWPDIRLELIGKGIDIHRFEAARGFSQVDQRVAIDRALNHIDSTAKNSLDFLRVYQPNYDHREVILPKIWPMEEFNLYIHGLPATNGESP